VSSLGICFLVLLAGPGRLAAQDSASRLFPASADNGGPAPSETASLTRSSPVYRLLPEESRDHEPAPSLRATEPPPWTQPCPTHRMVAADSSECEGRMAFAGLAMDASAPLEPAEDELPRSAFLERHRLLLLTLPILAIGGVMANSLIGYDTDHGFQVHHEGFFGRNTVNGGADKASHLTDYFIIANLFEDAYRMLGYSENAAILWGFGMAIATGLANEVSDGFTKHGFSWA